MEDVLKLLKEKLSQLMLVVKDLKAQNEQLTQENFQLAARVHSLEELTQHDSRTLESLSQEKELTRVAVDDLLKDIDALVEHRG